MFVGGRRLGLAMIAALMCLAVVGCSGSSDSPRTLPPLSTTPTPSQTSAPPQSPKAAAVAVVKQYFRLINNLEHDMNADAFVAITTPDCPCRSFADHVRRRAAKGQHYFGHIRVTSMTPALDSPTQAQVLVSYNASRGGTATDDGQILYRGQAHRGATENFVVRLVAHRWRVALIEEIRKGAPK